MKESLDKIPIFKLKTLILRLESYKHIFGSQTFTLRF